MDEEAELPFVVKADVGRLPDGSAALRLTYAATERAFEARQWDVAHYVLAPEMAQELGRHLLGSSSENSSSTPKASRH